jgi:hypothetical protein
VREDYSTYGTAWKHFPHDHARFRAYRWSEDGIGGVCDDHQSICFALALWNGHDPSVKERLLRLTGNEESVVEEMKLQLRLTKALAADAQSKCKALGRIIKALPHKDIAVCPS